MFTTAGTDSTHKRKQQRRPSCPSGSLAPLVGADSARGLLAIIVCVAHSWLIFVYPVDSGRTGAAYLFGIGARMAVIGFFCLSGYLIAMSIRQNHLRNGGAFQLREYALSRAFRIFPPLLFSILLTLVLIALLRMLRIDVTSIKHTAQSTYAVDWLAQIRCLATLCISGDLTGGLNGPLWSLAYEIQLYAIFGLGSAAVLSQTRFIRRAVMAMLAIILPATWLLYEHPAWRWLHILCFAAFTLGWSAFYYSTHKRPTFLLSMSAVGLTACLATFGCFKGDILNALNDKTLILAQIAFALAFSATLPLVSQRSMNASALAKSGRFSYTLYITHFPLLLFLFFILVYAWGPYSIATGWAATAVCVPLVVLFAYITALHVERPKQQLLFFLIVWNFSKYFQPCHRWSDRIKCRNGA